MAAFLDGVKFLATSGGTGSFVYAASVTGYQSPAFANAVDGQKYKYHATSTDLTQWEDGEGVYTVSSTTLTRMTVLYSSSSGAKINFTNPPQVSIVALKEDLLAFDEANSFTSAQQAQARANLGIYDYDTKAAVVAATISAPQNALRTGGFYAVGDDGGGLYVRKGSLDANAFGFQSADGAWWQLVPERGYLTPQQTGAKTDATDSTAAIQAALSACKCVHFPGGQYNVSATLVAQSAATITGEGLDQSLLLRNTVYGPTLQFGSTTIGDTAASCSVDGLYMLQQAVFNNGSAYVAGTSTTITNKETAPHIVIFKGQNVVIKNSRLYGAGGLAIYGTPIVKIDNMVINGIWDARYTGMQECLANIGLYQLVVANDPGSPFVNTEVLISNCFTGGIGHTEPISQTIGNVTFTQAVNCGSLYGVYCQTAEGLVLRNNYIGGNNGNNVLISPQNITSSIRIHHNFLDGARQYTIRIEASNPWYANLITIDHNTAQGYGFDDGFLFCADIGTGVPSCANISIKNNVAQGYQKAAVSLNFVEGVQHSGNIWRDYNCKGSTNNDPTISSGLFCTTTYLGDSSNNLYGGATNDPTASNFCQWGSYFTAVSGCTAALERAQNLGLTGGSACNITQTYPT